MSESSFEEISFRNIVVWYKDELLRIDGGERAALIFNTRCERVKLIKKNVLTFTHGGRIKISERAKTILYTP